MSRCAKSCLTAVLVLSATLLASPRATSGWTILKPDLRVASVKPSTVSLNHCRLVFTNTGLAASAACKVRVTIHKSTPVVKTFSVPSMPANSGLGMDLYMGTSMQSSAGQLTVAYVDALGQVSESNEWNNTGSYVAPAW